MIRRSSATLYPDYEQSQGGVEYTFGLYSALRACSAMVFRSRRQSRLTVATMFLEGGGTLFSLSGLSKKQPRTENTHCKVGTMPLLPVVAPGVAAGVAGVTPLPLVAFPPACWSFTMPFAPWTSFTEEGGVRSPAPPGKESEEGEVKARAWCALDGWVVRESILRDTSTR